MKRQILIALAAVMGTACLHADDTNKLIESNEAMAAVEAVADAGDTVAQATAVSTNRPVWKSSVSFGLTLTRGNSDALLADATFNTHRNSPTNEWTFGAEAAYGENDSVENTELLHGFGQYNHLFGERWFGYARVDGLHDGIAAVKYRFTLIPGAGYYFIKTKATTLAGEAGPGVVFERLDGEQSIYLTPRLAERFEHKVDGHTRFWQNVEFLPQADKPDNFLINAEVGMEAALTKRLSLRTVLDDNYANVPAPGRLDNDVKLISGLAYKF